MIFVGGGYKEPTAFCSHIYEEEFLIHGNKELSTNNCYEFKAIFLVFQGFFLQKLQQLFSGSS